MKRDQEVRTGAHARLWAALSGLGLSPENSERLTAEVLAEHAHELAEKIRRYAEEQDNEQRHDGAQGAAYCIDPEASGNG